MRRRFKNLHRTIVILFNHFEEISDKMKPVGMTVLNLSAIP